MAQDTLNRLFVGDPRDCRASIEDDAEEHPQEERVFAVGERRERLACHVQDDRQYNQSQNAGGHGHAQTVAERVLKFVDHG